MSTIRPLATVAILAALGVFLAQRINQGPVASTAQLTNEWDLRLRHCFEPKNITKELNMS